MILPAETKRELGLLEVFHSLVSCEEKSGELSGSGRRCIGQSLLLVAGELVWRAGVLPNNATYATE